MSKNKHLEIGGQAVIEGVMMRSPHAIATAVRVPDGRIVVDRKSYVALSRRYRFLNLPILRGAVAFFEMLAIGLRALNYSADIQMAHLEMNNE